MKIKVLCFVGLLALLSPVLANAGSACATPTILVADGRVTDFDFVAQSGTNFYQFAAVAGHSYSIEARQDYDDVNSDIADPSLTTYTDAALPASCGTLLSTGTTINHTETTDPVVSSNTSRFSFTAAAAANITIKVINSNAGLGHYLSVSVSDTTLYNPRWSTFGGFVTQWGLSNTSNATVHGTLTVTDGTHNVVHSEAITIAGGKTFFAQTSDAFTTGGPLPPGGGTCCVGSATFANDGPPGAVLADAYFLNGTATVVVPSKFEPVRRGSH